MMKHKYNYLPILVLFILIVLSSCSKDEPLLNNEYILNKPWIRHSYSLSGVTDGYVEHDFKREYTFFETGEYSKTVPIYGSIAPTATPPTEEDERPIIDIEIENGEWVFDTINNIIDFKYNDTITNYYTFDLDTRLFIGTEPSLYDWEIIEIKSNAITVRCIHNLVNTEMEYTEKLFLRNNQFNQ